MISIIIPVYNEEDNVAKLHNELVSVMKKIGRSYEIILIDDGSSDETGKIITKISHNDKLTKSIVLARNFGQTAALSAGLDNASGDIIIPMDGDLQNDPRDIPKLLKKIEEGYSVVSGWRKNRKDSFFRVLPSKIANLLIKKLTGVQINDNGCSLKAYKKEVISGIQLYGEMHRFISVYAAWSGGKTCEVVVNHRSRKNGKSKYGYSRIFKVILDLLVMKFLHRYISRPIHFFGKYGFWSFFIAFAFVIWSLILKYAYNLSINRTPLPIFAIMFVILGVQLVLTGILAELLTRTYYESQGKKSYKISYVVANGKNIK
ncbi:MAG: Undecaprenyl-phosphate 4-deoxy-4-formamido-L-arabinose transferase [bacterium ADurb.Bin212]|nr:MAG: Undecaprenyl-phosphate 4-deoxy-4-formamido-L-arabinose transferase [bacterium ADurb.Bin212]